VILTGPPKTPRGGSPAFATRLDAGDEMTPTVQDEVPRRGLVELKLSSPQSLQSQSNVLSAGRI
jgi:hypothetical protein